MSTPTSHIVDLPVPLNDVVGVTVSYPARERSVERVSLAKGPLAKGLSGMRVTAKGSGRKLALQWVPALEGGALIGLDVLAGTTPPAPPRAVWTTVKDVRWQEVFKRRKEAATADDQQKYLFELDRNTYQPLMKLSRDVRASVRQQRIELGDPLVECLKRRLEQRSYGNTIFPKDFPPPKGAAALYSKIFSDAAKAALGGDTGRVCDVLERFAAGEFRLEIPIPLPDHPPEVHAEPDSYYVFFFAEFGLLCLDEEADRAMWEALLPSLVKMQPIFLSRFPTDDRGRWAITDYGTAPRPPAASTPEWRERERMLRQIDADYAGIKAAYPGAAAHAQLLEAMKRNLKAAGTRYRGA